MPGLMRPATSLPSQVMSSSRRFGVPLGPHSPLHCPFSGWPNCANAIAGNAASIARTVRVRSVLVTMFVPLPGAAGRALARLRTRAENRLAEIVNQAIQVLVVLLADVLRELSPHTGGLPADVVPHHRERPRVRARIGHGRLVAQLVLVRTRPALHHFHLVGVRMAEVIEPAVLVEAL